MLLSVVRCPRQQEPVPSEQPRATCTDLSTDNRHSLVVPEGTYVLSTKAELGDQLAVAGNIAVTHVIEHAPATTHQHEQTTTAVVVLWVVFQVIGEMIDTFRQRCDLDIG